jgi:DNA-binding NarL/FixJ family response regulator
MEKLKLWIIEDNSLYTHALKLAVSEMPNVTCACAFQTAEDGLSELKNNRDVELLLLDIELPGMNGLEAIEKFLKLKNELKIIVLTQHSEVEYVLEAIEKGAVGYCLKSSDYEQLSSHIQTVLSEDAVLDSRLTKDLMEALRNKSKSELEVQFTDREQEVLGFLVRGLTKKMISEKLFISYHTVDKHIRAIYKKLDVNNVSSAVAKALKFGLVKD